MSDTSSESKREDLDNPAVSIGIGNPIQKVREFKIKAQDRDDLEPVVDPAIDPILSKTKSGRQVKLPVKFNHYVM